LPKNGLTIVEHCLGMTPHTEEINVILEEQAPISIENDGLSCIGSAGVPRAIIAG